MIKFNGMSDEQQEQETVEETPVPVKTKRVYNPTSTKVELVYGGQCLKIMPKTYVDVPDDLVIPRVSGLIETK